MRAALIGLFLLGCGAQFQQLSEAQKADVAINAAAQGLHEMDVVADTAFQNCLAASLGNCAGKYRDVARAESTAYSALIAAQHTVNAVDAASKPCQSKEAISNAVTALGAVVTAVTALGVQIPPAFTAAISGIENLVTPYAADCGAQ